MIDTQLTKSCVCLTPPRVRTPRASNLECNTVLLIAPHISARGRFDLLPHLPYAWDVGATPAVDQAENMSTLKYVIVLLATGGCLAFRLETSRGVASRSPTCATLSVMPPLSRHTSNKMQLMSMSFEGTEALAEAVSQAAFTLADASRGGAVVEQIPYVPAAEVMDFDKILLGSAACVLAYAWAAYEFGKVIFPHVPHQLSMYK